MQSVGVFEAKTHLTSLLNRVEKGEKITITRHGAPVAILVPATANKQPDIENLIKEMAELRKGISLGGESLRDMIDEGRA